MLEFRSSALDIVAAGLIALVTPPDNLTPSQWAARHMIVTDGPRANTKWDPLLTPYILEPLDSFGADSPVNEDATQKSAQTGFTMMAIAACGYSIDCDPAGGILLVQPTEKALDDFLREKFNPTVEATPPLRAKVYPQISRSGEGSTAYTKKYPGGSMALAIANSAPALRSKTKKRIIRDEASEYPLDLDKQGSPHDMITARRTSFLASGDWKDLAISTPTIVGDCYITKRFEAGDQRYWHVDCPGCGDPFYFEFGPQFRFEESFPHKAHYVAPCCGTVIEANQRDALVLAGSKHAEPRADGMPNGWIATAPGPGKPRSRHFDVMSSPFVPWDETVKAWLQSRDDPAKLKTFTNLWLGRAYEMKGDAPDHERLMERREDYRKGHIPPRGLMLTGFADVQMRGIYVEIVAFAPNRESWTVWTDVLEGDTTDHREGAFAKLDELYRKEFPDAFGGRRSVDAFGVDSGFRSHVVYAWCRQRHKAYATKGVDGWHRPAIGTPGFVDVDLGGHKIAQGVQVWPVGTWPLKGHWYEDLRREGRAAGKESDPPGYCHFGKWLDEIYFRQITAEYLAEKRSRGHMTKAWEVRGKEENHFLDCRIGNMALADHLGLSRMTDDEWKILARDRAAPLLEQGNLFAPRPLAIQLASSGAVAPVTPPPADASASPVPRPQAPPAAPAISEGSEQTADATVPARETKSAPASSSDGWLGRNTKDWLK